MAKFVVRGLNLASELAVVEADDMKFEGEFLVFRNIGDRVTAPVRMIRLGVIGDVERADDTR